MSKIIKKGELDLVIESTLKEVKLTVDSGIEVELDSNLEVNEAKTYNSSKNNSSTKVEAKTYNTSKNNSSSKTESEDVIGTGDTGDSDEAGAPESEKGEKEFDKDEDKTNISEKENTCDDCGKSNEDCECEKEDIVEVSVSDLAESVVKTTQNDILKESLENFNKLINYRK